MNDEDPRGARHAARYREDGPLPQQHYPDLATGEWIACFIDWTPEGRWSVPKARGSATT
jgi:hypothetical protein